MKFFRLLSLSSSEINVWLSPLVAHPAAQGTFLAGGNSKGSNVPNVKPWGGGHCAVEGYTHSFHLGYLWRMCVVFETSPVIFWTFTTSFFWCFVGKLKQSNVNFPDKIWGMGLCASAREASVYRVQTPKVPCPYNAKDAWKKDCMWQAGMRMFWKNMTE